MNGAANTINLSAATVSLVGPGGFQTLAGFSDWQGSATIAMGFEPAVVSALPRGPSGCASSTDR